MVWRLDRLGRSLKDLIGWVHTLETQGIEFKSLQEAIDTSSPSGKLTFHLFAALAEFERNLIRERTQAGLQAARTRGRNGGRPKALDKDKRALVVELYNGKKTVVSLNFRDESQANWGTTFLEQVAFAIQEARPGKTTVRELSKRDP